MQYLALLDTGSARRTPDGVAAFLVNQRLITGHDVDGRQALVELLVELVGIDLHECPSILRGSGGQVRLKARAASHEQGASPGVMVALNRHGPMMIGCPISWSRAWRTLRFPISTNLYQLLPASFHFSRLRLSSIGLSSIVWPFSTHGSRLMTYERGASLRERGAQGLIARRRSSN